jgi:glycosyltransferase involved in cell wall biosynthesis
LFVGNLLPVKAPDVLLDACERLTAQELDFACYLVGDGPLKPSLERRVRERGLSGRVTLCGALPHSRLPDWFRAASVVALPSYSEGVPNVLLEALACGTPFVASRVGGIPEIADSGVSRLVPPGCADSLARALRPFLTRPAADTPASETHTLRSWDDSATELAWLFEEAVRFSEPSTALTLANA